MKDIPLGSRVPVPDSYDPSVLCAIPRRFPLGGMHGFDLWRCYELFWLGPKGKPETSILELIYPVQSRNIVESKSLKLYLAGFANETFLDHGMLEETIRRDLEDILSSPRVDAAILPKESALSQQWVHSLPGACIDGIDAEIGLDRLDSDLLRAQGEIVKESLVSHLLRTYCPITRQPDVASVLIEYRGKKIDRASLLRYVCSFRGHEGFSEECCDRIFMDVLSQCSPLELTVGCFYTRRGGIDINPIRSTHEIGIEDMRKYRLVRQ
jgi:7-cyano-7-deazaguanine reductase